MFLQVHKYEYMTVIHVNVCMSSLLNSLCGITKHILGGIVLRVFVVVNKHVTEMCMKIMWSKLDG